MTQLHLVKLTTEELKEIFGSDPGELYDHYQGLDTVSERSAWILLNDQELDALCINVAESQTELHREHLATLMTFDSEDLHQIARVLTGKTLVEISGDAMTLLKFHMHLTGEHDIVGTMDELFSVSPEVWFFFEDREHRVLGRIAERAGKNQRHMT